MRGFGQQSIVYQCSRRDATITGTVTLIVCPEMGEEEEVDSQVTGAVLQGLACEPWGLVGGCSFIPFYNGYITVHV